MYVLYMHKFRIISCNIISYPVNLYTNVYIYIYIYVHIYKRIRMCLDPAHMYKTVYVTSNVYIKMKEGGMGRGT